MKEISRQYVGELHGVCGDGRLAEVATFRGDNILQTTAHAATNLSRKSSEKRLVFGHTESNQISGFPTTFLSRECA